MKITAKLALSQVKLNRKRSIAAISSITLATALMTAVSCFATSGIDMVMDFFGGDVGVYSGLYASMLCIPAIIFGLLIFYISVSVISNIFRASANQRMKDLGVLRCVGGTTRQIKETICYESIWLSLIGISLGTVLGLLVAYIGVGFTGKMVSNLNELQQSIIMRPLSLKLRFVVTPVTILVTVVVSFLMVLYSAYKPAKMAGKVSAVNCIKGMGTIQNTDAKNTKAGFSGLGKIEWKLANVNLSRNKYAYKPTIRSLAIGLLLLISTSGVIVQVQGMKECMNHGLDDVMVDYGSRRSYTINEETGKEEVDFMKPIYLADTVEMTQKLEAFAGCDVLGIGLDNELYVSEVPKQFLTSDMTAYMESKLKGSKELSVDLLVFDKEHYEMLCESAGVPYGSNLLINHFQYNDNGKMKEIIPFTDALSCFALKAQDGSIKEFEIAGTLSIDQIPQQAKGLNDTEIKIIVEDTMMRFFDWYCKPADEQAYMEYARKIADEKFPTYTSDSYALEGFSVRISRVDTMVKVFNIAIVIAQVIIYGFVALLLFIGFVSVASTLTSNIMVRYREFAVLRSVGMTVDSLQKVLIRESLLCTLHACIIGIPIGVLIPWVINLMIRQSFPILYEIPVILIFIGVASIFVVTVCITLVATQSVKKQNIIEVIHNESI